MALSINCIEALSATYYLTVPRDQVFLGHEIQLAESMTFGHFFVVKSVRSTPLILKIYKR